MRDYPDTMPVIPKLTAEQQARLLRYYSSECADTDDAARDYESEDGRDTSGPRIGLLLLAVSAVIVCVGVAHLLARFA